MLLYIRPVTQNTIRWVPASFRVVLLIVIYYIYVVFIQVVTGSCALIFIIIAEKRIRYRNGSGIGQIRIDEIFLAFLKKNICYSLGCKNANFVYITYLLLVLSSPVLFITDCFCFLVLFFMSCSRTCRNIRLVTAGIYSG